MSWWQLHITQSPIDPEKLSDQLSELKAVSVSFEDAADEPILEPELGTMPLWQQTKISALFNNESNCQTALNYLQQHFPSAHVVMETFADQVWERAWMDHFQPMRFGKRTWVCPSTHEPPDKTAVNLLLDPGLAFGTGTHPTTALCLEWIDGAELKDKIVVDYGAGSGILGIAALLHGAAHVYAVDHDEQALQASRDNALRNQVNDHLSVFLPNALPKTLQADFILANILATPLIKLAPEFARLLKPRGQVVLSGILVEQKDAILQAYQPFFTHFVTTPQTGWLRVVASKI